MCGSGFKPYEFDYGFHTYLTFKGTDLQARFRTTHHKPMHLIHKSDLKYTQELQSTMLPYQELQSTIEKALINSSKLYKRACNSPKAGVPFVTPYLFLYCNRAHSFSSFDISRKHFRDTEAFIQHSHTPIVMKPLCVLVFSTYGFKAVLNHQMQVTTLY